MNTTIKYILLTAIRDWLFMVILIATAGAVFLSNFLGSTVMIEQSQMTASFTAASSRIVLVTGIIVFVCFHVRRAFENKEIDLMLSRPISRGAFIISYWLGFSIVAILIISFVSLYLTFFVKGLNFSGLSFWLSSMVFELFVVIAFAVFSSVILTSSVSAVLLCFGFYIMSRMIGFFNYILEKNLTPDFTSLDFYSQKIIWVSSFLLPRLDLFAKSDWLIYGVDFANYNHLLPIGQALIYVPLLLTMAVIDFKRKQF
jgi:ABC-type transport system involved in multi-copper enzyme maturation permease subunit